VRTKQNESGTGTAGPSNECVNKTDRQFEIRLSVRFVWWIQRPMNHCHLNAPLRPVGIEKLQLVEAVCRIAALNHEQETALHLGRLHETELDLHRFPLEKRCQRVITGIGLRRLQKNHRAAHLELLGHSLDPRCDVDCSAGANIPNRQSRLIRCGNGRDETNLSGGTIGKLCRGKFDRTTRHEDRSNRGSLGLLLEQHHASCVTRVEIETDEPQDCGRGSNNRPYRSDSRCVLAIGQPVPRMEYLIPDVLHNNARLAPGRGGCA